MSRAYTIRHAKADVVAASTDAPLVAAVAAPLNRRIRVIAALLTGGAAATTAVFTTKPAGAGTAISHTIQIAANGTVTIPLNEYGWFETNAGEGLSLTTGAGGGVGVTLTYLDQE